MGIPDGAHTHGSGGSGLGPVVLVILAVALLGPAVTAAAVTLLHVLVIVPGVMVGVGAVCVGDCWLGGGTTHGWTRPAPRPPHSRWCGPPRHSRRNRQRAPYPAGRGANLLAGSIFTASRPRMSPPSSNATARTANRALTGP
jgi:hypothetical protein